MATIASIIVLCSFGLVVAMIAGLIRPALFVYKGKPFTRGRVFVVFFTALVASIVLFSLFDKNESTVAQKTAVQPMPSATATVETAAPIVEKVPSVEAAVGDLVDVVKVVDGDTIDVSIAGKTERIRFIGIDTPETVDPRKSVECFGVEASNKMKALLTGKRVRLEADASQGDRDVYGRLLRYIFSEDGANINKVMIQEGYAHEYTYNTPYKFQTEFKAAEKAAKVAQLGLWNPVACNVDNGISSATPTSAVQQAPVVSPSVTQETPQVSQSAHIFYLSTYSTAKYYYCDTDDGWKSLSTKYLKSYPSEEALLKDYPTKILHQPCQ